LPKRPARNPDIQYLWPTPVLSKRFGQYQQVNPELMSLFAAYRREHGGESQTMFASRDTLQERYKDHPAMTKLIRFITDSVFEVASHVNAPYWKDGQEVRVGLTGVWFQISNQHAFHETHVHGNSSWSGVYYVQAGDCSKGPSDKRNGMLNGITRFYGPHLEHSAGGYADIGNLFQQHHWHDSYPADGTLVVFPTYLKHMVFPYAGEKDRIIVSFHAKVFGSGDYRPSYVFQ
jgi:hypothetical protein